nr:hypothetical protein [Tanacetum cinerariifolium]
MEGLLPEKVTATDLFSLRSMDEEMEGLQGLIVVVGELRVIAMDDLVRLHICERLGDTWAWVAQGPESQHVVAARAPKDVEGAHTEVEGV